MISNVATIAVAFLAEARHLSFSKTVQTDTMNDLLSYSVGGGGGVPHT